MNYFSNFEYSGNHLICIPLAMTQIEKWKRGNCCYRWSKRINWNYTGFNIIIYHTWSIRHLSQHGGIIITQNTTLGVLGTWRGWWHMYVIATGAIFFKLKLSTVDEAYRLRNITNICCTFAYEKNVFLQVQKTYHVKISTTYPQLIIQWI